VIPGSSGCASYELDRDEQGRDQAELDVAVPPSSVGVATELTEVGQP
jgi:hypothetical protein